MALAFLPGCTHRQPTAPPAGSYFGPTDSLNEVIDKINANNELLPTLWARFAYSALIIDPQSGKTTELFENTGNSLLYRGPGELRLRFNKTLVGVVLDIGVNRERYWFAATPPKGDGQMYWGLLNKHQPGDPSQLPIQPESILQVLSISTLITDLLADPAPLLRFNNDADAYMLSWSTRAQDRHFVLREVWYDRKTLHPILVLLYDRDGRVILRAYLRKHVPVPIADPQTPSPEIASELDMFFPESKSRLLLNLQDIAVTRSGAPNDASFRFYIPESISPEKVKQVDAETQN